MPDPRVGTVLAGRYKILERTTSGSMGVVYRAERLELKRALAIKFLNEGYAASEDGLRRFEVEARAMSRLEHPNCVPVIDFGVDQGAPYLVMDFIKGCTLGQLLTTEWRLAPPRAVAIMRQVAAGLAHAHAQRIIHRDVKPANILVSPVEGHGEHARIVDFGLAKLRDEGSFTTGIAVGTPSYMSPEQTVGEKADERADVYACGVILYELLTGVKPFQADTPFEVMRMHREATPLPLSTAAAGVAISPALEAVVMRALAKPREHRFQSMSELRAALEAADEGHGKRPARGRRATVVALGAAALTAAGFAAWLRWGRGGPAAAAVPPAGVAVESAAAPSPDAADGEPTPPPPRGGAPVDAAPADPDAPFSAAQITKLQALAESGDLRGAIAGLEALRRAQPNEPAVHYALAGTYAEDQAWTQSVQAYRRTLELDPAYRSDSRLIADVVEALGSKQAHKQAARVIEQDLRTTALARLDEASRSSNRDLRARARKLRARLR